MHRYVVTLKQYDQQTSYFLEIDQLLPLAETYFDGTEVEADDQRLLDDLLRRLGIDFEPERGEVLMIDHLSDYQITRLQLADLDCGAPQIVAFPDLYRLALQLEQDWAESEGVDWKDAELLISELLSGLNQFILASTEITQIIRYAKSEQEWDSAVVATWPETILRALEDSDKQYSYRPSGDDWEVYSANLTGQEDWVATVSTESVARRLAFEL